VRWVRASFHISLFLLGLLLTASCSPIVDAKFSDIQVTRPDISVPAAPTSSLSSMTFSFSFDSTKLGANANLEAQSQIAQVDLNRLELTAKGGVTDLSFIRTLHAFAFVPIKTSSSQPTSQSTRQVEIADYVRRDEQSVGATFSVPLPEPVNILPLVQPSISDQRKIVVVVNLGGQLPSQSWTLDVLMSIAVEFRE
jgi:hypothetical protein